MQRCLCPSINPLYPKRCGWDLASKGCLSGASISPQCTPYSEEYSLSHQLAKVLPMLWRAGGFLSIWINKRVFHPLLSSNALCFGKWILLQVTECNFVGSPMLIHWQCITSVCLELAIWIAVCCSSTASTLTAVLNTKPVPAPEWLLKGHLRTDQHPFAAVAPWLIIIIKIIIICHAYSLVGFLLLFGLVSCPICLIHRFINSYDISKPTAKETASKSVIECHIASHTYTRYNILGHWCKITQTPLPSSTPSLNTATYKNHLFLFHIKASTSVCQQDSRLIPEKSSCLHRNFSCWPLLWLVYTFLWAVIAAHPAPGSTGAQGSDL